MTMGLSATCRAKCDNCEKEIVKEVILNKQTAEGLMGIEDGVHSYARDIWSWCIPDRWIQITEDKITKQRYLFFCEGNCFINWLSKQGRTKEAEEFKNAVWIA
jgi:hypothetical protein